MKGHKGAVTGLAINVNESELFSCSYDGTVCVWDMDTGNCLSTLFGHEMEVLSIDICGYAVTCGSDRTVRLWKYEEEKQFVFHGGGIRQPIDCVSLFNKRFCVTGSQDGRICLWDLTKKKPVHSIRDGHGPGNWISAIATLRFRKLFASGSNDGFVRIWSVTEQNKISLLYSVEIEGFVNDLRFSGDDGILVVQISQEQRLGRWLSPIQIARQGVYIIHITETKLD
jgi:ribosomal RNA-processing protein 9